MRIQTAFLFDLDGTLVDSVYQHVLAWKEALDSEGIPLSVWRIHRKIGMSGGLFTNQLLRETHGEISAERSERLRQAHAAAYQRMRAQVLPLPGARQLLDALTLAGTPWAVATSGRMETAALNLAALGVDPWACRSSIRSWSATASGTCSPRAAAGRSASVCYRAATVRKNSSARARCVSMTIRLICWSIWMKWPRGHERSPEMRAAHADNACAAGH